MAVGNHKAGGSIAGNRSIITIYCHFLDSIGNFFSILIFVQAGKGTCPVVAVAENKVFPCILAVCQQLDSNAFRTDAVLIVVIHPCFCYLDTGLFRCVAIGNIEIRIGRRVAVYSILGDGIGDFLTVCILGKICKAPFPAIFSGYGQCFIFQLCSVCIEADGNGIRTFSVLVVGVIPRLGTGNLCGFWSVAVGNHKAGGSIAGNRSIITIYCHFLDSIGNFFSILIFVQAGKGTCPVVAVAENKVFPCILAVCQQLDSNAFRTDAVLIVVIHPCFCYLDTGLFRCVAIGNIEIRIGRRVAVYSILGDGIGDFLTVCILGKICKAPFPAIFSGYGQCFIFQLCSVCIEADGNGIRTLSVLVVSIVPRLGSGDINGFRPIGKGDTHAWCDGNGIAAVGIGG